MRRTPRLIAGIILLGACAPAVVPRMDASPALHIPAPEGGEESPPGAGPMFMMRVAKSPEVRADQPLYILDGGILPGVPYLRPNDIASVEVVTGAVAASRFGIDPGRSVVLITSRWGRANLRS